MTTWGELLSQSVFCKNTFLKALIDFSSLFKNHHGTQSPTWVQTPWEHGSQNQLSRALRGSQRPRTVTDPVWLWASLLHICYGLIAWCPCGTCNTASWGVSDCFACAWDLSPPMGCLKRWPSWTWRSVPSLAVICYAVFGWRPWEAWAPVLVSFSFFHEGKWSRRGSRGEGSRAGVPAGETVVRT